MARCTGMRMGGCNLAPCPHSPMPVPCFSCLMCVLTTQDIVLCNADVIKNAIDHITITFIWLFILYLRSVNTLGYPILMFCQSGVLSNTCVLLTPWVV